MATGRPGPAALECAIDIWGKRGPVAPIAPPLPARAPRIDDDAVRGGDSFSATAKRVLIVAGGGALDASPEVTLLSQMLQAPVLSLSARPRRVGRPRSFQRQPPARPRPVGRSRRGARQSARGCSRTDDNGAWTRTSQIIRVDADKDEPARLHKPAVALIGDAAPILRRLIDELARTNAKRASRKARDARAPGQDARAPAGIGPQLAFLEAIRAELPEDGIFVDEVTQIGFAARLALPVYKPRTFLSPGFQDNLGWGFATALGAQDARRDVPVLSINGDGGFMYTANELATAMRHRIPLVAIVFADGAFGNVRRIQQEQFGNRLIASDLANPDFVKYAESFGAAGERARQPGGTARRAARSLRRARRRP